MSAVSDHRSTANLAVRYATAGRDDWVEILGRAETNGVVVPVLEHLYAAADEQVAAETTDDATAWARAPSFDSTTVRYLAAELRRRRARLDQFRLDLAHVHELLDGRAIPYAVIKTNVEHAHRPWDLNVLVADPDWPRVHRLLTDRGWERTTLRDHPLARTEPGKRLYEHDVRHPVHLHRAVSWNGLTYLPAEPVLDSRVHDDGVYYPDPVTDAVIHCAHSVFENFSCSLLEAATIVRTLGDDSGSRSDGPGPSSDGPGSRSGLPTDGSGPDSGRRIDDRGGDSGLPVDGAERGRALAAANGWPTGYDLAVTTARDVVEAVERRPASVTLPHEYPTTRLVRAWLEHARRTGGWHEVPLNLALRAIK